MKAQSVKWTGIALGYINDVVTTLHQFVHQALDAICPVQFVKSGVFSVLRDGLFGRYDKAINQVRVLLENERTGTPMTSDHYLNDNLKKW